MGVAALWGALASVTLLVGGVIAYVTDVSERVNAVIMAVGSGLLFGSVAFELVDDALDEASPAAIGGVMLVGALVFLVGDRIIERRGGGNRKDSEGAQSDGSALAIVFGSVLDGIPESFVLGLTVLQGRTSLALFVGIAASNLPEGLSSSTGLRKSGWPLVRVLLMWTLITVIAGVSAAAGYVLLDGASGVTVAVAQSFAAGALLTMLSDALLPEAYETEGVSTGVLVVIGFSASICLSAL